MWTSRQGWPLSSWSLVNILVTSLLLVENASPVGAYEPELEANRTCGGSTKCQPGVILPVWQPDNPSFGDKAARAIVYFVAMMYMFLGVSIIADRFMASIEVITSKEKEITITKSNGETSIGTVRIWNETVSNLTLMALGSSAPEILLSVIEVCGHNFQAGELGPGTIVGSAAFNMFVVIAVCVYIIPAGESRKIKHLRVFFVTASWSIFAYIWLYLILAVFSPGIVQVWEALLTLVFFPVCVVFAWMADKRLLFYKYVYKRYRADPRSGIIIGTEGEFPKGIELDGGFVPNDHQESIFMDGSAASVAPLPVSTQEEKELDESRKEVIQILKDLKQKHPDKELEQLVEMANYYALLHQQKSRAFYRIQATRMMTGAGNILKKHVSEFSKKSAQLLEVPSEAEVEENYSKIFFEPCMYHCLENCGSVTLTVACQQGDDAYHTFYVDYKTEDGSAKAGSDYEYSEGTLIFKPGETQKELKIGIIDDDIFEEDEHFFVRLLNLRVGDAEGMFESDSADHPKGRLVAPLVATVTILDDDHAGIFTFQDKLLRVSECQGTLEVKVIRSSGARGTVMVPYHTVFCKAVARRIKVMAMLISNAQIQGFSVAISSHVSLPSTFVEAGGRKLKSSSADSGGKLHTFASKVAALQDQCADASIGNVTGSNAVNVFLGLGVAWSVAAIYWAFQGKNFEVQKGTLAFSVTLFTIFAFVCISVLMYRRRPQIGGELGGPRTAKILTTALFMGLWFLYILFASLEAYCHIKGF
ncbi:hypothetical protein JRQ81_011446 [Phrynocephalus forsythii]|uniref:Calx-beta domain-containing protein n=1 Tax=Phrynocephalus forsythii TaxID=171643 RepID=A0A9Q0X6S6_9SAUR|nr:hypothetical protein JRQ81_011446 [Phrynocephalus forsythii]